MAVYDKKDCVNEVLHMFTTELWQFVCLIFGLDLEAMMTNCFLCLRKQNCLRITIDFMFLSVGRLNSRSYKHKWLHHKRSTCYVCFEILYLMCNEKRADILNG